MVCQGGSFLASFAIRTLVGAGRDLIGPAGQDRKGGLGGMADGFSVVKQIFASQICHPFTCKSWFNVDLTLS